MQIKFITAILLYLLLVSRVQDKERTFTASTPAGPVVRSFLGIAATDSVDFIRWKLFLMDHSYRLHCDYGIGKPNSNGFINGGKKIDLFGGAEKEKNYLQLKNGEAALQ